MEKIVLGKTELKVSGLKVNATILRNEHGNLEVIIEKESVLFPDGTVTDVFNNEITISKYVK
tara:strand:- start:865 stop:1050 length:186 start_codon:yes stop_codon:yes gene_type:complete